MASKHYLTNVTPYDGIEACVAQAAAIAGVNVFVDMGPMPTAGNADNLPASSETWCLVLDQPKPSDLTRFWNAYWALKFEALKS